MTELKVPIASDHDGPDWCRLTALWLAQREGSTMKFQRGVKPRPFTLHFADHDEQFPSLQDAANRYNLDKNSVWNLLWRAKKAGIRPMLTTPKGKAWPELLAKKAKKECVTA
jgi:hypothetical protein